VSSYLVRISRICFLAGTCINSLCFRVCSFSLRRPKNFVILSGFRSKVLYSSHVSSTIMIKIRKNEARILMYLTNTHPMFRYAGRITRSLDIDRMYLYENLQRMHEKGWLKRSKGPQNKIFYEVLRTAPIQAAKEKLTEE